MSNKKKKHSEQYKRVRENFDELPLEDKATFLVEAMFSTMTKGIETAGKAVSEELESIFEKTREAAEQAAQESKEKHAENGASTAEDEEKGESASGKEDDQG